MNGATHLEQQFGVVVLDLVEPKATLFSSASMHVSKNEVAQDISLPAVVPATANGIRIAVLHYRFSQVVNGVFYGFQEQKRFGVKVVGVWV